MASNNRLLARLYALASVQVANLPDVLCCAARCCAVVPRDSAWFSFWDGKEVVSVFDQDIFKQDW